MEKRINIISIISIALGALTVIANTYTLLAQSEFLGGLQILHSLGALALGGVLASAGWLMRQRREQGRVLFGYALIGIMVYFAGIFGYSAKILLGAPVFHIQMIVVLVIQVAIIASVYRFWRYMKSDRVTEFFTEK